MNEKCYSDNPEIRKIQEHAEQLGIYEIIYNILCEGKRLKLDQAKITEWESCSLNFTLEDFKYPNGFSNKGNNNSKSKRMGGLLNPTIQKPIKVPTISMAMADGTILFKAQKENNEYYISDFRFGKWVERITVYSQEVTAQYEKSKQEKLAQKEAEALKPFSEIDF